MQKLTTVFNKKDLSFFTIFYSEQSGIISFYKKKNKLKTKLFRILMGLVVLACVVGISIILSGCKEETKPINDSSSEYEVFRQDTIELKSYIFKQQTTNIFKII